MCSVGEAIFKVYLCKLLEDELQQSYHRDQTTLQKNDQIDNVHDNTNIHMPAKMSLH